MGDTLVQLPLVIWACLMRMRCVRKLEQTQSEPSTYPVNRRLPESYHCDPSFRVCSHVLLSDPWSCTDQSGHLQSVVQRHLGQIGVQWNCQKLSDTYYFWFNDDFVKIQSRARSTKELLCCNAPNGIYPEKVYYTAPRTTPGHLGRECTKLCSYRGRNC